ncbi:uncharacterized protein LOC134241184 [Saccostrea cucullata]|uniref:uncharacterized protein LOC134241184 n=1 Tax=Saccostrea cuccullata TaxID=36930 RepID=UPI002ED2E3A9
MKKGQKKERKRYLLRSKENAQGGDYQHYFNDVEEMKARSLRTRGYPVAEFQDPSHDYADYDEIKDQKFEAMLAEEKGYSTAEYESRNRPLPPIKADDDGYSVHVDDPSPEQKNSSTSNGSSSPPGNGGYLSPLQEEKEAEERLVSTNSDSSSNKSEKSEKSRKYQNEPPCDSSSEPITPYELIKNTEDSKDHQYIKLKSSTS